MKAFNFDTVRVMYWAGQHKYAQEVATYEQAVRIGAYSANASGPEYYDCLTGEKLIDDGTGLRNEAGIYTVLAGESV